MSLRPYLHVMPGAVADLPLGGDCVTDDLDFLWDQDYRLTYEGRLVILEQDTEEIPESEGNAGGKRCWLDNLPRRRVLATREVATTHTGFVTFWRQDDRSNATWTARFVEGKLLGVRKGGVSAWALPESGDPVDPWEVLCALRLMVADGSEIAGYIDRVLEQASGPDALETDKEGGMP